VSKVYLYDDHFRAVCNYTGDSEGITYDFVNDIESWGDAGEVFDFEAPSSTNSNLKRTTFCDSLGCFYFLQRCARGVAARLSRQAHAYLPFTEKLVFISIILFTFFE